MTVGLIGFGRLGGLLAGVLSRDFTVRVHDARGGLAPRIRKSGAVAATLAQACRQDVVILCVPVSAFEGLIRRIRSLLKPGALVVDVCAVKEHPARVMKRLLPKNVEILATHPAFGPDSAAETLKGRKIVLHKVRVGTRRYRQVKSYLADKGLRVVELSPKEHDRQMASSLVLTHFIGRSLIRFGARGTQVDTESYKRLLHILQTVQNDSWGLFEDMNKYNAFAQRTRKSFIRAINAVDRRLARSGSVAP